MLIRITIFSFCVLFLCDLFGQRIDGLTVVAPPRSFTSDPFVEVEDAAADWVCFVPYGFTRNGETDVHYNLEWQWWGERDAGLIRSIELAKEHGLKIMLKPQVYMPGSWPGDLHFDTESDWQAWEASYTAFILHWAEIANTYELELFCIGTEFKLSTRERESYWRDLISTIRDTYCGELTYSANWDEYTTVAFWDALDYIGVSTYFPLLEEKEPTVKSLLKAWKPIKKKLKAFSESEAKQLLFTEFGYLSVDGCCGKTWELEKQVKQTPINEQCQANGLEALFETHGNESWWAGGFLWKWFPNGMGHEGYVPRDYTPQDKLALQTLKYYYEQW